MTMAGNFSPLWLSTPSSWSIVRVVSSTTEATFLKDPQQSRLYTSLNIYPTWYSFCLLQHVKFNCDIFWGLQGKIQLIIPLHVFLVDSILHCYTMIHFYIQLCVNNVEVTVNSCTCTAVFTVNTCICTDVFTVTITKDQSGEIYNWGEPEWAPH